MLRPLGTPLPLAMLGLSVASVMLAGLDLGFVPPSEQHAVAIALVAFAFPLQGVAAVLGFLARDAVVGSGFGVQSASWLTIGLLLLAGRPGARSDALSLFCLVAAAALVSAVVVAAHSKLVPALVMAGTVARFVLTGLYERSGSIAVRHASGWEGIFLAALAIYTAIAADVESTQHRTVLPLGRFGPGRRVIEGGWEAQLEGVENESGVREQL